MKNTNFQDITNYILNAPSGKPIRFHIPKNCSITVDDRMLQLLEGRPYIRFICDENPESVVLELGKSYQPFIINDKLEMTPLGDAPMNNIAELD
ncbi:hypothetical protein H6P87_00961 [Rickettsia tillamookensis]|uniref:Uncharacterized protein n=1 Tax=Rickettsia tillamookensis TaxID=2761623 RepID=A0A9E6MIH8_9RICK|nr:hypothetical protein [Rickettsia tillamookensis]QQV75405.1 hypothetical protein H6P87_00961 [Rickettsia tillamookensis]